LLVGLLVRLRKRPLRIEAASYLGGRRECSRPSEPWPTAAFNRSGAHDRMRERASTGTLGSRRTALPANEFETSSRKGEEFRVLQDVDLPRTADGVSGGRRSNEPRRGKRLKAL